MIITLVLPQPPAYSETFFRSKIKGLQESGHQVILVTGTGSTNFDQCEHLRHPVIHTNSLKQMFQMLFEFSKLLPYTKRVITYVKLERKERTSIKRTLEKLYLNATLLKLKTQWLHFGFATMAIDRELVAKAIGAKLSVSFRGYDIEVHPNINPMVYSKLWVQLDKVHSISNYLMAQAYKLNLPKNIEHQVIQPAIELKKLSGLGNRVVEVPNKINIVTVARLHWIKGIDELIEVAYHLKKSQLNFVWTIIGGGDQKSEERYKFHAFKRDLENEINFAGKQTHEHTLDVMKSADVYAQTSLSEGFCNAVLEAQALGKLIVVPDAGALPENVVDHKTGWLVPSFQPEKFAEKIIEVLNLPDEEKLKISENAINRVKREVSLELQKEKFNHFFTSSNVI